MSNLTEEQKIVLEFYKLLGANWLAVDIGGEEYFYEKKPTRGESAWEVQCSEFWGNLRQEENSKDSLDLITWEDEPISIDWLLGGGNSVDYWKNIPIDTRVEVHFKDNDKWVKRHYAGFEDGSPTFFASGTTSWSEDCDKVKINSKDIRVCE